MYDLIMKKRMGQALSHPEIRFFIDGFTRGDIPDYQASALLMAIWFKGMTREETALLTDAMARSGDMADLSDIPGTKVDKHSTGGVGDKTSLIIGPIVAACGGVVAKMSGRGLGHTGGTIDKLEAIPGLRTALGKEEFAGIVRQTGLAIIGQSGDIAPADKKLYALRDVTATVDSLPLIASSIMSKKLAAGSDAILLDVKTGSGAFMKTLDDSIALASEMVSIGESNGRRTMALITDMGSPLGRNIGNALELVEAVDILMGKGPEDLLGVCLELAAGMLLLCGIGKSDCDRREMIGAAISGGAALKRLIAMAGAQGADTSYLRDTGKFPAAKIISEVKAENSGYIFSIDAEAVGRAAVALGAGRASKEDSIDFSAGIVLLKKPGEKIKPGDSLALLHSSSDSRIKEAQGILLKALTVTEAAPPPAKHILARVTKDGVEKL
jgi:pyrimidine-nucleoside phosphorylase